MSKGRNGGDGMMNGGGGSHGSRSDALRLETPKQEARTNSPQAFGRANNRSASPAPSAGSSRRQVCNGQLQVGTEEKWVH